MHATATEELAEISQYLTFQSAGAEYAIGILQIKEILSYTGATRVPMAPDVIRGLINLRGSAVPVVDLAVKFGYPETQASKRACVVIVDVGVGEEHVVMGILADSVSEVIDLRAEDIETAPSFGTGVKTEYLRGLAKVGEGFVPLLDIERVLSPAELIAVADSTRETGAAVEAGADGGPPEAPSRMESSPAKPVSEVEVSPPDKPDEADGQPSTEPSARASRPRKKRARS